MSGPNYDQGASLFELSQGGKKPIQLSNGLDAGRSSRTATLSSCAEPEGLDRRRRPAHRMRNGGEQLGPDEDLPLERALQKRLPLDVSRRGEGCTLLRTVGRAFSTASQRGQALRVRRAALVSMTAR